MKQGIMDTTTQKVAIGCFVWCSSLGLKGGYTYWPNEQLAEYDLQIMQIDMQILIAQTTLFWV